MAAIPSHLIVADVACNTCGGESIQVYHQSFPELRVGGRSASEAAARLVGQLKSSLDTVTDQSHRHLVERALSDIRAFLNREGAAHPARDLEAR